RIRDVLDDETRRGGDGQQLPPARLDGVRTAGDVGRYTGWLAAAVQRQAGYPHRGTSDRPVVAPEGRILRCPFDRQRLKVAGWIILVRTGRENLGRGGLSAK